MDGGVATRRVVVVGGGSAGWLTAGLLAARLGGEGGIEVTLLESPEVGAIGVGEGTWPSMRDTLRQIGVPEAALFQHCDASFKQGSRFDGWLDGGESDRYFHPFMLPQGYLDANLAAAWLERHGDVPFADLVSVQPHLCVHGKAPKQATTPEYAAVANYGYHFDAGKFGTLLREHCTRQLGVRHVSDHMLGVEGRPDGDIEGVRTRHHGTLRGELFVDCTGLASLLLGAHYGVGWISRQSVLFNDAALAVQVPYPADDTEIASQTIATAQPWGWVWDIGLPTRRGVGHVYSSAHVDDDEVERALRRHIALSGGPADIATPRKLRFRPGYRASFWHRNCVAVGLAAGFVEPLEASSLALAELSATALAEDFPMTRGAMDTVARRFNEGFRYRWERVIDFLKLHYALTRRRDTPYWREHAEPATWPERLRELLALWRHRPPSQRDFDRSDEVFPSASYQYVLFGMGFRPDAGAYARRDDRPERADGFFREAAALTRRMLPALPGNRELVGQIRRHGMLKV